MRALRGRSLGTIFFTVSAAGAVVAFALGLAQVYDRPPVEFGNERVSRDGLVATVQVNVRNRSDEALCPDIRIAARDREGLDLEEVRARPEGEGALSPGQSVTYIGVFRNLTALEYHEELDEFTAYAFAAEPCR